MAPGDLPPGSDFRAELVREIESCSVVLALISENHYKSAYANQELGFALCRGKQILPLCLDDSLPDAFISGKQCICCKNINVDSKISEIAMSIQRLSNLEETLDSKSANFYIDNLSKSENWEGAGHWAKKIALAKKFTADEMEQIGKAVIENDQVQASWAARQPLRRILLENKDLLSTTTKSNLESIHYL